MIYKKYQHIEKIGGMETEGILNGTVYLSYKIDGTNGCVWLNEDGTLGYGSRNRELVGETDNSNFRKMMEADEDTRNALLDYLTSYPNRIIYGEWLVPVNIKRYKADAWKKFYIFDVMYFDNEVDSTNIKDDEFTRRHEIYIDFDTFEPEFTSRGLNVIPLIAKLENPSIDDIKALLPNTANFLITEGVGEGIVIKNYNYINKWGRRTWAKMLTEDFLAHKSKMRHDNHIEKTDNPTEHSIINLMTPEHVIKEKSKIEEAHGGWSDRFIPELLNRAYDEFIRDNWEIIFLKKYRTSTINLKVLKQYSDNFIKHVIGVIK